VGTLGLAHIAWCGFLIVPDGVWLAGFLGFLPAAFIVFTHSYREPAKSARKPASFRQFLPA